MLVHLSPNCVSTEGSQSATGVTAAPNEFLCVYFVTRTPLHVAHIHTFPCVRRLGKCSRASSIMMDKQAMSEGGGGGGEE